MGVGVGESEGERVIGWGGGEPHAFLRRSAKPDRERFRGISKVKVQEQDDLP